MLQPADPFLDLSGEDIRKRMYLTSDAEGRELCLRPDLTIPVSCDYLASPEGKGRYQQRGCSIEPFFATLKAFFHLDPLPVQGKTLASVVMLLSLYAWDLLVLLNFVHHRPLGQVKPILDLL